MANFFILKQPVHIPVSLFQSDKIDYLSFYRYYQNINRSLAKQDDAIRMEIIHAQNEMLSHSGPQHPNTGQNTQQILVEIHSKERLKCLHLVTFTLLKLWIHSH